MGRDLYEGSAAARDVFDTADGVLGYSLSQVCLAGPSERLKDTRYTQPAIMTVSLAALAAAHESGSIAERPAFTAGHSLGEYTALVASGALTFEEGLKLIAERARLMAQASASPRGTLAAILGLDEAVVLEVCREAGVDPCNLNLPDQTVIGGEREAVLQAIEKAKARGARRGVELSVSGAFHSRLMRPALPGLLAAVERAAIETPAVPVIANASARALRSVAAIREELGAQIAQPVRWHESVRLMADAGVTTFIEIGPGKVLTGMVKRLVPGATIRNIGTLAEALVEPEAPVVAS